MTIIKNIILAIVMWLCGEDPYSYEVAPDPVKPICPYESYDACEDWALRWLAVEEETYGR